MATEKNSNQFEEINEKLTQLEKRISTIEDVLHIKPRVPDEIAKEPGVGKTPSEDSSIETKVGEVGLAWLGNIVLFFGIIFMEQYIQTLGYEAGALAFGYLAVAGVFIAARFLVSVFPNKVYIFNLNAWLLLYYVTLKSHFFTESPFITSEGLALGMLVLATLVPLAIALKNRSFALANIAMILLGITAIVGDSTTFTLSLTLLLSGMAMVLFYYYGWKKVVFLSLFIAYTVLLIWFMNNPVMGHPIQAISEHHYGHVFLFLIAATFSIVPLIANDKNFSLARTVWVMILNGILFSFLLGLIVLTFFPQNYVILVGSVSAFCILYAVLLQLRSEWKVSAALYALYGFVTLSVSAYGVYGFPNVYFILAIQSLLVLVFALWFRSRFIVMMNTMLFIVLLLFYLINSPSINGVNISFTLAALITARILNWKKDHLTIQTEWLRNTYLLITFILMLITLYHIVPEQFVTLSWGLAAIFYFGLSLLLKRVKYRYMALGTMLAAAGYLFIVDLSKIELVFRIVALMFLAVLSIGLSVYYTRKARK